MSTNLTDTSLSELLDALAVRAEAARAEIAALKVQRDEIVARIRSLTAEADQAERIMRAQTPRTRQVRTVTAPAPEPMVEDDPVEDDPATFVVDEPIAQAVVASDDAVVAPPFEID